MGRVILHCDLNNFYASVECLYRPELKNKPVAVCGESELRHGIVLAKNQIAKLYGIQTGDVIWQALKKCPNLVVLKPNFPLYIRFSKLAQQIYSEYTDLIEPFGIDECWLDVTESTKILGSGRKIAYEIKERIKSELGLTLSVGVSFNKVFAKLGSDYKKPDAVTVITKENFKQIVWPLPAKDLLYVGSATEKKLSSRAIYTIGDIAKSSPEYLKRILGKWGEVLWIFANGLDTTPVTPPLFEDNIKGIGNSITLPRDLTSYEDAEYVIRMLSESVALRLRQQYLKCFTIQVWIRDSSLFAITRQEKLQTPTFLAREIAQKAFEIFKKNWSFKNSIRSIGVRALDLVCANSFYQLEFDSLKKFKLEQLEKTIDRIRKRFGHTSVLPAVLLTKPDLPCEIALHNKIHPVAFFK
ncbi:DNA-directed DNA polymerase [Caldicellulosiruptor obsidiansis OB47]|uniref:DNA polymerase IV n=1 Tax=Caldicellulosiruptor obsidiansis (strain ATCC BAA-2073 / JCM 16842 / OB47) TaxID=608506 RepID=D9TGM1_CALOO|nr:DNA polymerase IV [Caldicellulosiruptor obsidiansis]ADL43341.1 DNA-directed DNA polymerase [Caldicellulosiruptor obsidiansis OB47]